MPSNGLGECSIWHASYTWNRFKTIQKNEKSKAQQPSVQHVFHRWALHCGEDRYLGAQISRFQGRAYTYLHVHSHGVAEADTLKYIWIKERSSEELYVLLFKIFRGKCWGGWKVDFEANARDQTEIPARGAGAEREKHSKCKTFSPSTSSLSVPWTPPLSSPPPPPTLQSHSLPSPPFLFPPLPLEVLE